MTTGALSGSKIVELGNRVSAPFCAKMPVSLGAEVIKVEKPEIADMSHSPRNIRGYKCRG
jgi:crotonobetainyl-CoA:carnitine CoA-transferase CaiB-like acyl-CoA transferase